MSRVWGRLIAGRAQAISLCHTVDARRLALKTIVACWDGLRHGRDVLDELQGGEASHSADSALASELAMGVLRHRITCEHLAAHFYRGRWEGLSISLRAALALGVYQLCWLDRIPDHAAANETVRLTKGHGKKAAGMVNAIMRKLIGVRGDIVARPETPAPRRYLTIDERRGRLFTEDVFPDPARRPLEYLIAATGHPPWLVERWHRRFKPSRCGQICAAGARRPKLVLRANRLRTSTGELLARLCAAGHAASMVDGADAIQVVDAPPITQMVEFAEGLCQPQDSTAQIPVRLVEPKPGEIVLDLCAGVGTKATLAAEAMNDQGVVVAADVSAEKLEKTVQNARRLGLTCIRTALVGGIEAVLVELQRRPDVILVDAPCTNTGVLARRPEARYRVSQKTLTAMVALQREILCHAAALAGPSTRIVYSTCSLEREENEEQVEWFREQFSGWPIKDQRLTLPDAQRDGGFVAIVVKRSDSA